METPKPIVIKRALRKVTNVADFCRRHGIPERTVRRTRTRAENYVPGATVLKVIAMGLREDGLLEPAGPPEKAAA